MKIAYITWLLVLLPALLFSQEVPSSTPDPLLPGQWREIDRKAKNQRFEEAVLYHFENNSTSVFDNYDKIVPAWEMIRRVARRCKRSNPFIENAPKVTALLSLTWKFGTNLLEKTLNGSKAAMANAAQPVHNLLSGDCSPTTKEEKLKFASELYYSEQVMLQEKYYAQLNADEIKALGKNLWLATSLIGELVNFALGYLPPFREEDGNIGSLNDRLCYGARKLNIPDYRIMLGQQVSCEEEEPGDDGTVIDIPIVNPVDPNEIIGPAGYGGERWIAASDPLPYTILYENDPELATAAARQVLIRHPFDDTVDPFSFRLGDFGFGDYHFEVPSGLSYYRNQILLDSIGILLEVIAGVDVEQNEAFWIFDSRDPLTGLAETLPVEAGFLPVNDSLIGNGEGFVNFTIKAHPNSVTGDRIEAGASIVFDNNPAIQTNLAINTIDADYPISQIDSIAPNVATGQYQLSWSGTDIGAGIASYDLYRSANGQSFSPYLQDYVDTIYLFEGSPDSSYRFFVLSKDHVGNSEALKFSAEPACMQIRLIDQTAAIGDEANGSAQLEVSGNIGELSYEWSHDPQLNSPQSNSLSAGWYTVIASDTSGCEVEITFEIEQIVAIEALDQNAGLMIKSLYPVPAQSFLHLEYWSVQTKMQMRIYTTEGKLVHQESWLEDNSGLQNKTLEVAHLPKGFYLLHLMSEDQTVQGAFIKQ
ncbi:MAG: T9SS type A sorting domain-containing protein [Bacteroidota bacterium]